MASGPLNSQSDPFPVRMRGFSNQIPGGPYWSWAESRRMAAFGDTTGPPLEIRHGRSLAVGPTVWPQIAVRQRANRQCGRLLAGADICAIRLGRPWVKTRIMVSICGRDGAVGKRRLLQE